MKILRKKNNRESGAHGFQMKRSLFATPYIVWMVLFTLIPLGIVFYYALTDSMTGQFTLANLASIGTYMPIFLRSIWLSLFASLICLVIGYPVAYFIAQCKPLTRLSSPCKSVLARRGSRPSSIARSG